MADFEVTKEYLEDLGERDAQGNYDYEYRYWKITFDFGDRSYCARIYTDTATEASIVGPIREGNEQSQKDVRAMVRHLVEHERVNEVQVPGGRTGGYEPIDLSFI